MRKTYTEIVKEVLELDMTSYKLAQLIDTNVQTIDKYRNGIVDISKMNLANAEKIVNFYYIYKKLSENT